ncbi:MAG: hypothetical protein KBD95_01065 [Veillonella sp.]|jgi:hypothetical protein|nr:hypothetical protein [Veillonella sp.]
MKKFIVALLLAMSVVAPGFAASWYQFYGDEYGKAIYVDNASVEKTSDYAAVWTKIVDPDGSVMIGRVFLVHSKRVFTLMEYTQYAPNGYILNKYKMPYPVWRPIQPDSNMEKLYYAIWSY